MARRETIIKILLTLLILTAAVYLTIAAVMFLAQTRILFPGSGDGQVAALPPGSERLRLAANGEQLRGVHVPPEPGSPRHREIILGFGGNAWNAEAAALYLHDIYPGRDVVAFHFRGYGPSSGIPGAEAFLEDAPQIHDFVASRFGDRPIVAVGFSVGSAVAARLARERPVAGVILVTPFDSLTLVARSHYPWLPVGLLLRHRLEPAADLRGAAVPVALIAAERDELIPPERIASLRRSASNLVFDRTIGGAGHNDLYGNSEFRDAMGDALAAVRLDQRR